MKIAFIGGGNMATAMIGGLFASQDNIDRIQVADPNPEVRERLEERWPVKCFSTAAAAVQGVDTIVLAIKPQSLPAVLDEIGSLVSSEQVIISIVAGIPINQIAEQIAASPPIVRTMPNLPALVDLGITGMYACENCGMEQRLVAEKLMQKVGEIVWLEQESLLDVVTAVSGSGPAYIYFMIEAMQKAGSSLGLPEDVAGKLALHSAYGASAMAVQRDIDVTELRTRVTSKGGTTEAALACFEAGDFMGLVYSAIAAATQRGQELAAATGEINS